MSYLITGLQAWSSPRWFISEKKHRFFSDATRAGLPTRRSVHVVKALRSWIELAIAHPTTSADSADDVVVSVQVQKSGDILPFGVQALAAEDVLEWLQPSGRRPEGCCCSTELSGGRGRELGVAGYYTRPIMHAPHTLRLTLANIQRKTFFRHESFDHAWQNAVRRCSTLASMYSSHAMQQEQSSSDGEGRDCSSPRTHRGAPAALWAL